MRFVIQYTSGETENCQYDFRSIDTLFPLVLNYFFPIERVQIKSGITVCHPPPTSQILHGASRPSLALPIPIPSKSHDAPSRYSTTVARQSGGQKRPIPRTVTDSQRRSGKACRARTIPATVIPSDSEHGHVVSRGQSRCW